MLAGYTGIDYSLRWPTLDLEADLEQSHGEVPTRAQLLSGVSNFAEKCEASGNGLDGASLCRTGLEQVRDLYLAGRRLGRISAADHQGVVRELTVSW